MLMISDEIFVKLKRNIIRLMKTNLNKSFYADGNALCLYTIGFGSFFSIL